MSRIAIKKDDINRVLLTEVLPYETPMLFSNKGFYSLVRRGIHHKFFAKIKSIKNTKNFGIPFDYEINKTITGETRTLSIIHPINQIEFINFYKKYDALIIHLCARSPFSLRKPAKIAKFCYSPSLVFKEDTTQKDDVEVEPTILDKETPIFKSYYSYKKIDLIYKFYERNEFQRLEQRYNLLLQFDISKCFYNIYTHSITWAVKGKENAKRNIRLNSFENFFDKIMQEANYNETNGIIVGPEISRIFAEIILQQVDLNTLENIQSSRFVLGVDYEIRRYIDDYFVFANDRKVLDIILETYRKQLEKYKLYLNPSKTNIKAIPFISDIAVGKYEIRKLLNNSFSNLFDTKHIEIPIGEIKEEKYLKKIRSPYSLSKSIIKEFQCITKRNNLEYHILSKDVVRYVKNKIIYFFTNKKIIKDHDDTISFLLLTLDILFYAYSLHVNSSSTFKVSKVIVIICKYLTDKDPESINTVFSKIFRESKFVITIHKQKSNINESNVDILNLLIALTKIGNKYLLTEEKLRMIFQIKNNNEEYEFNNFNYFNIVSLLYYLNDSSAHNNLRKDIEAYVEKIYSTEIDPLSKSEYTILFFDYLSCPFISKLSKRKVVLKSRFAKNNANADKVIEDISKETTWFMNWNPEIDLERVLKTKEWGSSY